MAHWQRMIDWRRRIVVFSLSWMIHRLCSFDHITDTRVNLRLLRIPERIQLKVAVLVYKVLHDSSHSISDHWLASPTYLVDMHAIWPARISWTYRSFDCQLSTVVHSTLLSREFGTACQFMWSQQRFLPHSDRDCLKNHLAYTGPSSRLIAT